MKLKVTYYKQSGKYYGEESWEVTDDDVETLKRKHGYGFQGVTDFIKNNARYNCGSDFYYVVELVDQPDSSHVFCQFLGKTSVIFNGGLNDNKT